MYRVGGVGEFRRRPGGGLASELQCLRGLLPDTLLFAAQTRAAALNVSAERVLIAHGVVSEEYYIRALARHCDIPFNSLTGTDRRTCPLDDRLFTASAAAGIVPIRTRRGMPLHVVAPANAGRFLHFVTANPGAARRFHLTTRRHLQRYVMRHGAAALAEQAVSSLSQRYPAMSAKPSSRRRTKRPSRPRHIGLVAALLIGTVALAPLLLVVETLLALVFIAWAALRLTGLFIAPPTQRPTPLRDHDLPTYSIVAALYHEAPSIAGLVQALCEIDYPREKLEIKIVLEPDDPETRAALDRLDLPPHFDVLYAPACGPRTKPKALNAALPFITGSFVVVFDAEDRPAPDQLRIAAATFFANSCKLACVQARLAIDKTADGWLTGFFTAEYAALFELFLPALAALRAPLPLGGTSNHLRVDVLRKIGGWDSYNVTEDADLGMRLARLGYRTDVIDSITAEEAPNRVRAWLQQRTRWFKGWMQTWLVHMRDPQRLFRELGPFSFVTFQLVVGGNVLAALLHPVFLIAATYALLTGGAPLGDVAVALSTGLFLTSVTIGYVSSIALGWSGLIRRGMAATAWVLLLTPLHWLMLSCAGWRALNQLIRAPYRWEKTEHGVARTTRRRPHHSHLNARLRRLERLERDLSRIIALDEAREQPSARRQPLHRRARFIVSKMMPGQKYWRRSAAASSGLRLRSNGRTN